MEITKAVKKLDSLAQETRLKTFRMLVKVGVVGLPAGKISEKLGIPNNTLSFHLNHLVNAKLITSRKEGRSVIYYVNFEETESLIKFLLEKCCTDSEHKICISESTKSFIDKIVSS
jgi:DNA-binding transcriptional ArsR family regulator